MRVGDLVTISPSRYGFYLITSLNAVEHRATISFPLPDCVMVVNLADPMNGELPMNKKWLEVISEAPKSR